MLRVAVGLIVALGIVGAPRTADAQIDPLAIIRRNLATTTSVSFKTHLVVAMDTSLRMQFDADGNYYDPYDYTTGNVYDTILGISSAATRYRRMYTALQFTSTGSPKFETSTIAVVGNNSATSYANFYAKIEAGRREGRAHSGRGRKHPVRHDLDSSACGRAARPRFHN